MTSFANAFCNNSPWVSSDINVQDGDMPASNGKRRKISSQKLCIVFIFNSSGLSIYVKNTFRACIISASRTGNSRTTFSNISRRTSSGAVAHSDKRFNILVRISPAAALVYVRHKIPQSFNDFARNNIRNKRCTNTNVFPVPAFAWTQTFISGVDALFCSGESSIFLSIMALLYFVDSSINFLELQGYINCGRVVMWLCSNMTRGIMQCA